MVDRAGHWTAGVWSASDIAGDQHTWPCFLCARHICPVVAQTTDGLGARGFRWEYGFVRIHIHEQPDERCIK